MIQESTIVISLALNTGIILGGPFVIILPPKLALNDELVLNQQLHCSSQLKSCSCILLIIPLITCSQVFRMKRPDTYITKPIVRREALFISLNS